jgi:hypothetical protein
MGMVTAIINCTQAPTRSQLSPSRQLLQRAIQNLDNFDDQASLAARASNPTKQKSVAASRQVRAMGRGWHRVPEWVEAARQIEAPAQHVLHNLI